MAASLLSTASPASIYGYGATLDTRPRPALFTLLVLVSYYPAYQQNDSTQSLPLRQHLLVSAISHQATRANKVASRTRHPAGEKAMR